MGNSIIASNGDVCIVPFKQNEFYVGPKSNSPVIDVSDFTDGANKKAELVLFKGNDTYITVTCYD